MKIIRLPILAVFAACCLTAAVYAGDPTGTWQWTNKGHGDHVMKATLKLELKDGQLLGSLKSHRAETVITDASFNDPVVAFSVTREHDGESFTAKYSGTLDGDTITGTMEMPSRDDGDPVTHPWTATRVVPTAAPTPDVPPAPVGSP
jgi:hypothetical protein